ncbi:MAG: phosphoenolpyruvate carboxykinase (ATP) [Acidobacteria bacterium]|nr:phosphoenolpyruvate carboxykinase (ATP) [Acidobacteriota bacterium]
MGPQVQPAPGLGGHGIHTPLNIFWNLSVPALYEEAVRRKEGVIAANGPLVCLTGVHTGRSPNDKLVVREPSSEDKIWWGPINRSCEPEQFDLLHRHLISYLDERDVFVRDCYAGADPDYRLRVRIISEYAWHSLFARHMFIDEGVRQPEEHDPEFVVINAPGCKADPSRHGTRSDVFILIHFGKRLVLIGGSSYAGETKKSIFTALNYLLPLRGVLSMHCSANVGKKGDVALFFGLSGTGKTTLSSDPERGLIGDDEHGWSDRGVFNFEGGCYAKVIRLSAEAEPQIHATTGRFGTLLENVVVDPITRELNLDDGALTENTRASYPLEYIDNAVMSGRAGHPQNIVMLTADAFGVLPPISRLSPAGAMYHFLSGYTAKVAGTEKGVTEPVAAFSTCFGAPFLPLPPGVYARALGERISRHRAKAWLVNTGWSGGPYGVGDRMKIAYTRAMINAALNGDLDRVAYERDPIFNVEIPLSCPDVPAGVMKPRNTWADKAAYDSQAKKLARMFVENFKTFESSVTEDVRGAGPKVQEI